MVHVTYHIVEHDGGWAYKFGDVFSETFATKELAHAAATSAAREQKTPGESEIITYEDSSGHWPALLLRSSPSAISLRFVGPTPTTPRHTFWRA